MLMKTAQSILCIFDKVRAKFLSLVKFLSYVKNKNELNDSLLQAHFLLKNMFDEDVHCPIASQELKMAEKADTVIEAILRLYAAYAAFSELARDVEARGYELNENWLNKLNSANQHLFEKVIPHFSKYDQELLYFNFPRLYSAVARATYHFSNDVIVPGDTSELDNFVLVKE